jgi:hypothetical protein
MNPWIGWTLAALLVLAGWTQYGWQGAVFALSAVVFWLLLQFNKAMRVMRQAGTAPVGSVESAVMFNAKLKPGMPMLEIVMLAKSLGQKLGDDPERYRWTDLGNSHVTVELRRGRAVSWTLWRPEPAGEGPGAEP